MSATDTELVKLGEYEFDLTGILQAVGDHPWTFAFVSVIVYIFFISRKDGLLSQFLSSRLKQKELDAQQDRAMVALTKFAEKARMAEKKGSLRDRPRINDQRKK